MKKSLLFLLIIAFISSVLLSVPAESSNNMIVSIPVDFTFEKGVEGFFSRSPIDSIADTPDTIDTIEFTYDGTDNELSTGAFYYNIRVFTPEPISVFVINPVGFNKTFDDKGSESEFQNTIDYKNNGRTKEQGFVASGIMQDVVLLKENSTHYTEPRSYWLEFDFTVYPSQLTTAADMDSWKNVTGLRTTLKLEVRTE